MTTLTAMNEIYNNITKSLISCDYAALHLKKKSDNLPMIFS